MSTCVYAIFSHNNPVQVVRLVRTLRAMSPDAAIVVHHDPTYTELPQNLVERAGGVMIPDPIAAEWGDFSQVEQHLHTMRWCLANLEFEWFITLTGQTYPIKPLREFEIYLRASVYDAYVTHFDAYDPAGWPSGEASRRYHYHYVRLPKFRYWHRIPGPIRERVPTLIRAFNRAQPLFKLFTFPRGLPTRLGWRTAHRPFNNKGPRLIAGNQNTNYRKAAVRYILDYVDATPFYTAYFQYTALPDEVFFTTILVNAPSLKILNDNLRYINWPKGHAANAAVMNMDHWDALRSSPAFFALKFDANYCPELLDCLDEELGLPLAGANL
ncbi:MAG: beta-1,6-N-acetylglucosaminyltransferase [Thiobacillus sp.]